MSNRASEGIGRLQTTWGQMGLTQRLLAVGLVLALALAVGLGLLLNRTEWVVLVSQADPKDAAAVVARLQELKVPYRPVGDGYTITVPKAEQYTAKLALAQAGLPKGGSVGMELFDEPKFGATDFDRKVNYLRAQQGELERALMRIAELEYANVKLAIPEKSVFVREQQPVTAAVMIQVKSGRKLSNEQVQGIVSFMAGSVQGLTPENVKVVDQSGRLLATGTNGLEFGLDEDAQLTKQLTLQRDVEHRVQTLLEPIFGPGNVIARVNVQLNLDASRIESQTVGNSTPKVVETVRETSQSTNQVAPADPGQGDGGNPPVYQGQGGTESGSGDAWKSSTTTTYEVSQRKEVTVVAPGSVKRISVGIAVNRPDLSPEQVRQIQETIAGATGADLMDISVAAMSFSGSEQPATGAETPAAATPGLNLNLIYIGGGAAVAILLLGFLMSRRRRQQEEEELEAAAFHEPVPGTRLDVALGLEQQPLAEELAAATPAADDAADDGLGQNARERIQLVINSKPRRQLLVGAQPIDEELLGHANELIEHSPEAAAQVLKQWLKGGQ